MPTDEFSKLVKDAKQQQEVKNTAQPQKQEEKKPFKPDPKLWIPVGIVVALFIVFCIYVYFIM